MRYNSPRQKRYVLEAFGDELRCPLCHDFLRDPMLTKECLHRFCARCVQKEIANGLQHCPTCSRPLATKVPFKSDPNFASILNKFMSQRKEYAPKDAVETIRQHGINLELYIKKEETEERPMHQDSFDSSTMSEELGNDRRNSMDTNNESNFSESNIKSNDSSLITDADKTSLSGADSQRANGTSGIAESSQNEDTKTENLSTSSTSRHIQQKPSLNFQNNNNNTQHHLAQQLAALFGWGEKQRMARDGCVALVLWPDGSVYRDASLPRRLRIPRYIYLPTYSTVGHLAEYLLHRCMVEENWRESKNYRVELSAVVDERDEFELRMCAANKVDYLTFRDRAHVGDDCSLLLRNDFRPPSIFLATPYPFCASASTLTVAALLAQHGDGDHVDVLGLNASTSGTGSINAPDGAGSSDGRAQGFAFSRPFKPPKLLYRFIRI